MPRPKGSKNKVNKVVVLDATNVESVLAQAKSLARPYTASIKLWGKVTTATGTTALEAISNLKPEAKKGVGILTVSKGETSKTKVLNAGQTFRLFSGSRIMREIALKNVGMIFKDM